MYPCALTYTYLHSFLLPQLQFLMASNFQIYALFRREAPKLGREFLTCFPRRQNPMQLRRLPSPLKLVRNPTVSRSLSLSSARASLVRSSIPAGEPISLAPLPRLVNNTEQKPGTDQVGEDATRRAFFPDVSSKVVAYWLLGSAASVFGLVVFGGLTRLTESG